MTHTELIAVLETRRRKALAEIDAGLDKTMDEYDRKVVAGEPMTPHPDYLAPWIIKQPGEGFNGTVACMDIIGPYGVQLPSRILNVERIGNEHMPEFADEPLVVPAPGGGL